MRVDKLLQINSVVNRGSTGRIAEEIGELAISNGWESYIAYGWESGESKSQTIRIGNDFDIKMHGLKTRLFDKHGFSSGRATKEFVKQIDKIKPDIIHLHNLHGYYLNIEILFNYLATIDTPIVWTLHDCWPITGHCAYFDFVGCYKWKDVCYKCPQKRSYPGSLWLDRSKENFLTKKKLFNSVKNLTLVPVSNWLADIVKQSFLSKYPIKVINNGIDTNVFQPIKKNIFREKYSLGNKFIILGVAAVWNERKGLKDFLELNKKLDENYQIILVGLTNAQLKRLPQNIIGITRTNNVAELAEIYSSVDVFVNPTWEDNFPTTNLEAMACGTPVITYNTGGSVESVSPETGFIVEKGDVAGLKDKIEQIKQKGKSYYSNACVNRAKSLYDKNDRYLEYLHLYKKK